MEDNLSSVRPANQDYISNPMISGLQGLNIHKTQSDDIEELVKGGLKSGKALENRLNKMSSFKNAFNESLKRFQSKIENASKDWDADTFRI